MRALLLLSLPLLTGSILFACSDDHGASGPTPQPDAGIDVPPPPDDAGVVLTDAESDAGAPVTVAVVGTDGSPHANTRVVFHDASGAVLETKLTGADGRATSTTATPPAMATALLGAGTDLDLLTWTSVEGGDTLVAVDLVPAPPALGTLAVTFPGNVTGGPPPAEYQALLGTCQIGKSSTTAFPALPIFPECSTATPAVLGRAVDANDAVLKYATAKPAAFPPPDGGSAAVTLGAWTDPITVTLTGTNLPTGIVSAQYADIAGNLLFKHPSLRDVTNGQATFEAAPAGFADAAQPEIIADLDTPMGARKTLMKRAPATTSYAFDFTTALPTITATSLVATDPVRPEISWTTGAALTTSDGGIVRVGFLDGRAATFRWSFVVAPDATSVKAPAMPPEASDWTPVGGDAGSAFDMPEVLFVEADSFATASAFRQAAGVVVPAASASRDVSFALPQDGAVKTTFYQFQDAL